MAIFDNLGAKPDQVYAGSAEDDVFTYHALNTVTPTVFQGGEGHDVASFAVNEFTKDLFNVQLTPDGSLHVTATLTLTTSLLGMPLEVTRYVDTTLQGVEELVFYHSKGKTESVLTTDIKPAPIKLIGTADNDSFVAALQNDYEIDGLGGIDVVTFSGIAQEWGLQASTTGWLLEGAQAQGVHSLTNVERLVFDDQKIALDVDANALKTLQFIGVVAPSLLAAADIRGLILGLYDSGLTTQQLAKTALDLELLPTEKSALATQVIAHVLPDYKDGYTELHAACEDYITMHGAIGFVSDVVALGINVDLVGLQANGMSYV